MVSGKQLNLKIYEIICKEWPIHASGVCRILDMDPTPSNVSKVKYHFDKLKREEKIHTKKIDRALVAWPAQIDKIRVVHEFMKEV